jgi:hypothetical protein
MLKKSEPHRPNGAAKAAAGERPAPRENGGTNMTARKYLNQLTSIKGLIAAKAEKIEEVRARAQWRPNYIGYNPRTGAVRDRMSALVARICDLEAGLLADKLRLVALEEEIIGKIDRIDNPLYRQILTLRYVNGHKWEAVADKLHYHDVWVRKLHGRALAALTGLL